MKMLLLLAFIISGNSFAKSNLEKIEVYPPTVLAGCENEDYDRVGSLGLRLSSAVGYLIDDRISISFTNQLVLCSDLDKNGTQIKMRWVDVDPFKGFDVPYYDNRTNQSDTYHQVILPADSSNKLEISYSSEETYKTIASSPMVSSAKGHLKGTLTISQAELLDQNDLDQLEQGKTVSKRVELNHQLAMTKFFRNSRLNYVSSWSAASRFIKFTFKQVKGQVRMSSFSID